MSKLSVCKLLPFVTTLAVFDEVLLLPCVPQMSKTDALPSYLLLPFPHPPVSLPPAADCNRANCILNLIFDQDCSCSAATYVTLCHKLLFLLVKTVEAFGNGPVFCSWKLFILLKGSALKPMSMFKRPSDILWVFATREY